MRQTVSVLLLLVLPLLAACGGSTKKPVSTLPVIPATASTADWEDFQDGWLSGKIKDLDLHKDTYETDPGNILHLEFENDGELYAGFAVIRYEKVASANDVEASVRDQLGDAGKRLVFSPCSFTLTSGSCLELTNQKRWLEQPDVHPVYVRWFIQEGSRLYGISPSQSATFNIMKGIGPQILSTFKFEKE